MNGIADNDGQCHGVVGERYWRAVEKDGDEDSTARTGHHKGNKLVGWGGILGYRREGLAAYMHNVIQQ